MICDTNCRICPRVEVTATVVRRRRVADHALVRALGFVVGLSSILVGCFYDSSWGSRTTAQKHMAAAERPASLSPASIERAPKAARHVFKVRLWASPQFSAQTMDWKHEMRAVIEDANTVLVHAASTRLEIASLESWASPPDDLHQALAALRVHDRGEDVGWVIGLVGSFPKYTRSFHDLGMARLLGRHVVLRASSDLGEHEAAEAAYDKLDPSERLQLVAERKRHRSVAILLHEIGHTLGAVHQTGDEEFMAPTYSKKMHAFGPAATALLSIGAAHRDEVDVRPWAKDLLHYYEGATAPWDDKERTALMTELRTLTAPASATPAAPSAKEVFTEVPPELEKADLPSWTRAAEAFRAGKLKEAWDAGTPLFGKYPKVLAVQDLRCQTATKVGFEWPRVKAECAELMKLSTGK